MATAIEIDLVAWPEMATVAARMKQYRVEAGFSQQDLAKLVGTTQNYISMMEQPRADAKLTTLLKVARALRRPISDFFI